VAGPQNVVAGWPSIFERVGVQGGGVDARTGTTRSTEAPPTGLVLMAVVVSMAGTAKTAVLRQSSVSCSPPRSQRRGPSSPHDAPDEY
jgi:hypothetical protein